MGNIWSVIRRTRKHPLIFTSVGMVLVMALVRSLLRRGRIPTRGLNELMRDLQQGHVLHINFGAGLMQVFVEARNSRPSASNKETATVGNVSMMILLNSVFVLIYLSIVS